ncbi:MAG TPA: IS1634 family transposase [Nitriliruptorales bacterium]|nr:IS1634 family transposase [Nitriliruptorales bacterium]
MFIKSTAVRRGKRVYEYLSLVEGYRDEQGRPRHRTLFRLGEASKLRQTGELDRIIGALTAHAQGRFVDAGAIEAASAPSIGGITAVSAWWDRLGLGDFFAWAAEEAGLSWSLADAVFAMCANRLLDPASKRKTARWIERDVVAPDGFSLPSLQQYYRALDRVHGLKDALETWLYARLTDLTNLNLTLVCYDLTSTYFAGDTRGSERFPSKAFGYSRDHRGDRPQVVVGLLTTGDGIPIAHHVFAGNTNDVTTLPGVLGDLKDRFGVGRVCLVADRGLVSHDNLEVIEQAGCDWVIATRLHRRADVATVLAAATTAPDDAWVDVEAFDSRVCDTVHDGHRYVVVFSGERERRDTTRRLQLIKATEGKLLALEARVARGELQAATDIVAAAERILARSPVKRLFTYTASDARFVYDFDHDALDYDETLAGHYILTTSLHPNAADAATVLACYRSLANVEARFRVLKDLLGLRPVYHWTEKRVRGHIAVCVLAAVIEALIGNALRDADVRDPDLDHQHLTARRALDELDAVRQVTLTSGDTRLEVVTRRNALQQTILDALSVDTRPWQQPRHR